MTVYTEELTEKEEEYAQLRALGYTKSDAAKRAYNSTTGNHRQLGWQAEQRDKVKERILDLKEERAESSGLDVREQVTRYNEIYRLAMAEGKRDQAMKALARLDSIGGFDAPTKSVSVTGKIGEVLRDHQGDLKKDVEKFSRILVPHNESVREITVEAKVITTEGNLLNVV